MDAIVTDYINLICVNYVGDGGKKWGKVVCVDEKDEKECKPEK